MKAEASPAAAQSLTGEITGDPPTESTHDDQHHDHGIDQNVVVVSLEAVGPEAEAGVVVSRNAVEQGCPETLAAIGDVAEAKSVQHRCTDQDHKRCGEGDAAEGAADTAHSEFIQGLATVQPPPQAGALHHKTLQKGGDRHQPQPAGQDHQGQHQLTEGGEITADVDDRQTGHRDGGCGGEQGFPQTDLAARAQRGGQQQRAQQDHQQAGDRGELRHGEPSMPALAALDRLAEGHGARRPQEFDQC